jgi:dihydropteroate synthase
MENFSKVEDTYFPINKHLLFQDYLFEIKQPQIIGILNCTPDSFYKNSRNSSEMAVLKQVEKFVNEGVNILDIGGYSTRPGAENISEKLEIERVLPAIKWIKKEFDEVPLSLDTFRGAVAKIGLENGINLINDISAWNIDSTLLEVISQYKCPYILTHMQGTPQTMASQTNYKDLIPEILFFFSEKIKELRRRGIHDVIIDPGFGFGKTREQNYEILHNLDQFKILNCPILAGLSRKSMIYQKLNCTPEESLNGTTVLNTIALQKGASFLRVHDVKEAKEIVTLLYQS